jgi:hypothetical protein
VRYRCTVLPISLAASRPSQNLLQIELSKYNDDTIIPSAHICIYAKISDAIQMLGKYADNQPLPSHHHSWQASAEHGICKIIFGQSHSLSTLKIISGTLASRVLVSHLRARHVTPGDPLGCGVSFVRRCGPKLITNPHHDRTDEIESKLYLSFADQTVLYEPVDAAPLSALSSLAAAALFSTASSLSLVSCSSFCKLLM